MSPPTVNRRRLAELAAAVGGAVEGDPELVIVGVNTLGAASAGDLSFYGNTRYRRALESTRASAVLVGDDAPPRAGRTWVRVKNPHLAFARAAALFHPPKQYSPGVSPDARVHPEARVHPSATVREFATVGRGAVVGARAVLLPNTHVGELAQVGEDSLLYPGVFVADRCVVGARCVLHSGAVVGADGFGFAFDLEKPEHVKIPQAGIARLEDDVELGAHSCVDRATIGETVVGRGSKIDNLVQVGHNCVVGPMSILCAQVGLSGSTVLGTGVTLAGQVGSAGHLRIGDLAKVGGQAGIHSDVEDGATVMGSPVLPVKDFWRSSAVFAKLPELRAEIRELRRRVEALAAAADAPCGTRGTP